MYFRAALRACLCALDWPSDDASHFCKKNQKPKKLRLRCYKYFDDPQLLFLIISGKKPVLICIIFVFILYLSC